jgi:hypothetical protein
MLLGYQWNSKYYSLISGSLSYDLKGQQNSSLSNFKINSGSKYLKSTSADAQYYGYVVLPTNNDAKNISTFNGGLGIGHSYTSHFINSLLPFDLKISFDLQKNFHEYNIATDNYENNEYNLSTSPGFALKFTDNLSLSLSGSYLIVRSYLGNIKQKFDTDLSSTYKVTKSISCSFGIANRGDLYKANGTDTNLSFINDQNNFLHAGLIWQI